MSRAGELLAVRWESNERKDGYIPREEEAKHLKKRPSIHPKYTTKHKDKDTDTDTSNPPIYE